MSETSETFSEREDIEMMLPWYVAGTLEADEVARVERYLAAHPDMEMQLDLIRSEQNEAALANEMLGMPAPGGLERLRASIAADAPASARLAAAGSSVWSELKSLFSAPTPRAVQWAGMAAALVLMLQAGVIGGLMTSQPTPGKGNTYEVAGGQQTKGLKLVVRFAPAATSAQIADALAAVDGQIIAGPKPGGLFEVRIADPEEGKPDKTAIIAKLKSDGIVTLVLGGS